MDKFLEKTVSSETIYKGKIFDLKHDKILQTSGKEAFRDVVVHSGGVVIVAEQEGKILLVKQYRYPVEKTLLELPAGRLDKSNESLLEAAKRELLEETGYIASEWKDYGFVYSSPGFTTEKLYIFHAKDLTFTKQQPDEDEIIDYVFYDIEEVFSLIKNNLLNDAKTICALMRIFKLW